MTTTFRTWTSTDDADGDVVAKDDAKDSNPVVVFTPKEDGKYKVVMKLVETKARGSFVAYALLRKGGYDVPSKNLKAAWERLLGMCEKINDKLGWAAFHDGDNELCVIGSIMKEGETLTQAASTSKTVRTPSSAPPTAGRATSTSPSRTATAKSPRRTPRTTRSRSCSTPRAARSS